jgi:hypothetical protein
LCPLGAASAKQTFYSKSTSRSATTPDQPRRENPQSPRARKQAADFTHFLYLVFKEPTPSCLGRRILILPEPLPGCQARSRRLARQPSDSPENSRVRHPRPTVGQGTCPPVRGQ